MSVFPRLSVWSALCLILLVAPVFANTITVNATGSGSDGPLSASATFVTSNGQIQVTLTNTLGANVIRSAGQALSDISFTLSSSPGTLGTTMASGQLGDVSGSGVLTDTAGSPSRWLGVGGGLFSISGNTVTMEVIGGGKPNQMIIPFLANGGTYGNVNNGFKQFNPYTIGPATFTLALSGVTDTTTISDVVFSFGTGPDTFVPAPPPTPEPSSLLLLGSGLVGMVGVLRRKRRL